MKDELSSAQKIAMALGGIASELARAAKEADFSVGFGTLACGAVLFAGERWGKASNASVGLLAIGAFFVCAALGRLLDRKVNLR
jgi:hypothetical protein